MPLCISFDLLWYQGLSDAMQKIVTLNLVAMLCLSSFLMKLLLVWGRAGGKNQ